MQQAIHSATADPAIAIDGAGMVLLRWRRRAFLALAAFVLLGPAPGQLFGQHSPWLREWVMYSGVGVGIPKGVFMVHDETGAMAAEYTPLAAAGLDRYPRMTHYYFEGRVWEPAHMARFAALLCSDLSPGMRLSFAGQVGTRQGWAPMPVDDVCAAGGVAP